MNLSTKIKLFFQNLWNSWPIEQEQKEECFITIVSNDGFNIEVDFNFNLDTAPIIASILFQLDTGALTGTVVDAINQKCVLDGKEDELEAFMTSLSVISTTNKKLTEAQINEPIIKPSQVFRYTAEQPKLN